MSIVPMVVAYEVMREREQAAKAHARKETAKRQKKEEQRHVNEIRFAHEAEARVEAFEAKAAETLPGEETRTVREIRTEYDRSMDRYYALRNKERVLTDEKRAETLVAYQEAKARLANLEVEKVETWKAADRNIGWWDRWINGVEVDPEDESIVAVEEKLRAAGSDMYKAKRALDWDDKQLADPISEVDRLTREALKKNADDLAAKYPWVTRSPHQFPSPFNL